MASGDVRLDVDIAQSGAGQTASVLLELACSPAIAVRVLRLFRHCRVMENQANHYGLLPGETVADQHSSGNPWHKRHYMAALPEP